MKRHRFPILCTNSRANSGAALIEFALVAVVLLGIVLPGMIAVGKSISELNAAAQGAFLGARAGAEWPVAVATNSEGHATIDAVAVQAAIQDRMNTLYHVMASQAERVQVNPDDVTIIQGAPDTEHWMVQSDMIANFPAVLTNIPIRVKSVSSLLNVKQVTNLDLNSPQRLVRGGSVASYTCAPRPCPILENGMQTPCASACCRGYVPGESLGESGLLGGRPGWNMCDGAPYGSGGNGGEEGGEGGDGG